MKPVYSVIIPCYNEEAVIDAAHARLTKVMRGMGEAYELIFVDDGSRDATGDKLRALARGDEHVRAMRLARNFGQQIATTAGMDAAQGEAIVIIDADLQDPPEVIPEMAAKWREGFDVVYGRRIKRDGESLLKRATAWGYYRALRALVGFDIPADTGDFRLVSRRAADAVRAMPEHHRFLRGLFAYVGFRQAEVKFNRESRFAGETKYTLRRMLRLAADGVLSFSVKPLQWIGWLGALLSAGGAVWLILALALGADALAALTVLLSGLIVGCLGIVAAYLGRVYDEVKGRPLYWLAEESGPKGEQFDK